MGEGRKTRRPIQGTTREVDRPGALKDRLDTAWLSVKANLVRAVSIGLQPLESEPLGKGKGTIARNLRLGRIMSAQPLIAWTTRGTRAALEKHACSQGISIEELAGDWLTAEVQRRALPTPPLPDLAQPPGDEHRAALDRAKVEMLTGMTGREWREGGHLT
jgi:hypothetical protein